MARWRSLLLIIIILGNVVFLPFQAVAQTGLVPGCKYGEEGCEQAYNPDNYGVCELVQTFNNVLQFLLGISGIIIALVIVYAGFVMIISRGNYSTIAQAKGMFGKAVGGFVIMLVAFLVVNTVMKVFVGGDNNDIASWQVVDCAYSNLAGKADYNIQTRQELVDMLQAAKEAGVLVIGPGGAYGNAFNDLVAGAAGACDPGLVSKYWGNQAGNAQCIIKYESSCGSDPISSSDYSYVDGNVFSFGAMQINTTVHEVKGCGHLGIPDLDCKAAWQGNSYKGVVVNQDLYKQCVAALLNNECNMINGVRIYNDAVKARGNGWQPWSTASKCNLK